MSDVDVLESVLAKDTALLAAVRPEQLSAPTPCPEYDVQALANHIVGWLQVFVAAANGRIFEGDPADFVSTDPVTLERARATLPDQYRGEGKPFGHVIEVAQDAPVLDHLLGFMGRQP